jgi:L-iditol 2-dehydrogenase
MSDIVIEASGSEKGVQSAFKLIKVLGKLCVVGITGRDFIKTPWDTGQKKMLDVFFNLSSSYTSWDRALTIMENTRFDLSKLITHRERIENWQQVFKDLQDGKGVKALFIPEE